MIKMKLKNVLVVYYVHNYNTLELVERELRAKGVPYKCISRAKCNNAIVKKRDLIIIVGGDGTFLRTSHHIYDETPVMTVSSDTGINEGFFTRSSKDDFARKLSRIISGKYRIRKLPRLEARINRKKIGMLAVNEIFVGSSHQYHTSRYEITVHGKKEQQKSSGVLITTKAGSTGWAGSAAKKKLVIPEHGFGYVVREPYFGRLTKPKLLQGTLGKNEKIKVKSGTHRGIAVIDSSYTEHRFIDGDSIEVKISKKPIHLVEF